MIARINRAMSRKDRDKGFTLIELLVVIIIIGILAAIAVPQFIKQREKGFDAAVKSDLKNIALVAETNYTDALSYASPTVFRQGGDASGARIASKGTSYAAWGNADSYIIYGLSKSGRVFVLDSASNGTPEIAKNASNVPLTALPTGSTPTGYSASGGSTWSGPS